MLTGLLYQRTLFNCNNSCICFNLSFRIMADRRASLKSRFKKRAPASIMTFSDCYKHIPLTVYNISKGKKSEKGNTRMVAQFKSD